MTLSENLSSLIWPIPILERLTRNLKVRREWSGIRPINLIPGSSAAYFGDIFAVKLILVGYSIYTPEIKSRVRGCTPISGQPREIYRVVSHGSRKVKLIFAHCTICGVWSCFLTIHFSMRLDIRSLPGGNKARVFFVKS